MSASNHDAVFIVEDEFPTFERLWTTFQAVHPTLSSHPLRAESVRFSLENVSTKESIDWAQRYHPEQAGWLFSSKPTPAFLRDVHQALGSLASRGVAFRMTHERFLKTRDAELTLLRGRPTLTLFFEDRVENTLRFLNRYVQAFADTLEIGPAAVRKEIEKFHAFIQERLHQASNTYAFQPKTMMTMFQKRPALSFTSIPGRVGRHAIFDRLEIHCEDVPTLLKLFVNLGPVGRTEIPQVFLQFFLSMGELKPDDLALEALAPYLLESTFEFVAPEASKTESLSKTLLSLNPSDVFSVFSQTQTKVDEAPSVLYTLRKIPMRGYELRVNLTWQAEPRKDPEDLVAPFEKTTGLAWHRIV